MKVLMALVFLVSSWGRSSEELHLSVVLDTGEFTKVLKGQDWICRTEKKAKFRLAEEPDFSQELGALKNIPSSDPCEHRVTVLAPELGPNPTVSCEQAPETKRFLRKLGRVCGRF